MKSLCWAFAATSVLAIAPAYAIEPYIAIDAGISIPGNINTSPEFGPVVEFDSDLGVILGGRAGLDLFWILRAEGELNWRSSDVSLTAFNELIDDDGDLTANDSALGFFGNAYLDIPTPFLPVDPFIGLGIGGLRFGDADETQAAWQIKAGAAVPLTKRLNLDLTYNFSRTFSDRFDGLADPFTGHAFTLGLRFEFALTD